MQWRLRLPLLFFIAVEASAEEALPRFDIPEFLKCPAGTTTLTSPDKDKRICVDEEGTEARSYFKSTDAVILGETTIQGSPILKWYANYYSKLSATQHSGMPAPSDVSGLLGLHIKEGVIRDFDIRSARKTDSAFTLMFDEVGKEILRSEAYGRNQMKCQRMTTPGGFSGETCSKLVGFDEKLNARMYEQHCKAFDMSTGNSVEFVTYQIDSYEKDPDSEKLKATLLINEKVASEKQWPDLELRNETLYDSESKENKDLIAENAAWGLLKYCPVSSDINYVRGAEDALKYIKSMQAGVKNLSAPARNPRKSGLPNARTSRNLR